METRKLSFCSSRSPKYAGLSHFTLLFCKGQLRNVQRLTTHVHSHCSAHLTLLFGGVPVAVAVVVCLRFSKTLFNRRNLKTPALRFSVEEKQFENRAFRKRWLHDNNAIFPPRDFKFLQRRSTLGSLSNDDDVNVITFYKRNSRMSRSLRYAYDS